MRNDNLYIVLSNYPEFIYTAENFVIFKEIQIIYRKIINIINSSNFVNWSNENYKIVW